MKKKVFKRLRNISVLIFLIVAVLVAVYPFQNRDLKAYVETTENVYEFYVSDSTIKSAKTIEFDFADIDKIIIERIRLYGSINSICLKKIEYNNLYGMVDSSTEGEYARIDSGIEFKNPRGIKLILNEEGAGVFREVSQSFVLERLCLMEIALVITLLFCVVFTALDEKYDVNNRNNHGPIQEFKRFWNDLKKYKNYIDYAAKTDLKAEVANSYLNRLWWLLEPLLSMLVYLIVFGGVMGKSIENYVIFVYSALIMWSFFNKTVSYSVKLVRSNKDIVTKVYVPKFVLLLSNMCLNFYKLLFSMTILVAMLLIFRVKIGIEILMVIPAYVIIILLAFAVGMIFLHYGVYVDDLSHATGILLSMLMFLSGMFYEVMTTLSAPLNSVMLVVNPVAMVIDTMRNGLIYGNAVNIPLLFIWFFIAVILSCIGVHIVYKNENGYVKVV